jgi:hypothetical protein
MALITSKTDAEPLIDDLGNTPRLTLQEVLRRMRERGLEDESDWLIRHITEVILLNQS